MKVTLDITQVEGIADKLEQIESPADIITRVFHDYGVEKVKAEITKLLPVSGRHWKGKASAAKVSQPFKAIEGNAYFEVLTRTKYNYLYYPDDGSNTRRHQGNQRFMQRGAENSQQDIIDRVIEEIIREIEENNNG